jgi:integrase
LSKTTISTLLWRSTDLCASAAKRRFAAATALRRRADLGCRGGMGGSSCPRLLRRQGGGAGGGGCSTPERHADAPRRRRRFLDQHDLARSTRRVYAASLASLVASLGAATAVGNLSGLTLADWFRARYATAAPATWNRELATLRSRSPGGAPPWLACGRPDRRAGPPAGADRSHRALTRGELERRFARRDLIARERTLWRLLFETAARANELLALDVEDLDLANRRAGAQQGRRGGMGILADGISPAPPRLLASRTSGPVLLSGRKANPRGRRPRPRPHQRTDTAVVPASRRAVSRPHRVDAAPATPFGAHPRRRGRHQPPDAAGPVPARLDALTGALRPPRLVGHGGY